MNSFKCYPGLTSGGQQQNFAMSMTINSPWLFVSDWDTVASGSNQALVPNVPIVAVNGTVPEESTTMMPGIKEGGGQPFTKYQQANAVRAAT